MKSHHFILGLLGIAVVGLESGCASRDHNAPTPNAKLETVSFFYDDITDSGDDVTSQTGTVPRRYGYLAQLALDTIDSLAPGGTIAVFVTGSQVGKPRLVARLQTKKTMTRGQWKSAVAEFKRSLERERKALETGVVSRSLPYSPILEDLAQLAEDASLEARKDGLTAEVIALSDGQQFSPKFRWGSILTASSPSQAAHEAAQRISLPTKAALTKLTFWYLPGNAPDGGRQKMMDFYEQLYQREWGLKEASVEKLLAVP